MRMRELAAVMAGVTFGMAVMPDMTVLAADNNMDYRRKVVGIAGIMNNTSTGLNDPVTRAEFANMLVKASTYRDYLPATSSVSVYADVPATAQYASSIRIAAEQNWITGYLGGLYKPDQSITLQEAARGILALLGYTSEDFGSSLSSARMAKFYTLELNENLDRQPNEVLNRSDCINLFYNLLKTKKKDSNEIYGTILDCELNSDGEINPITILDDERKGPILVHKNFSVSQSVPFDTEDANVFLNGVASTLSAVKSAQQQAGFAVLYYNVKSKTIWAYTTMGWDNDDNSGNNSYILLKGEIKNIYYKSTDVMTPTSVRIEVDQANSDDSFDTSEDVDSDGYLTISLDSSELQYMFSIYGDLEVGDDVVLVCNRNGSSYTAVDALEY